MELQHEQTDPPIQKPSSYEELVQREIELRGVNRAQSQTIMRQAGVIQKLEETLRIQAEDIKLLKKKLYGSSSERGNRNSSENSGSKASGKGNGTSKDELNSAQASGAAGGTGDSGNTTTDKKPKRVRLLSEQYPNAEIQEKHVQFDYIPMCSCCNKPMVDSGLKEVTEQLHTTPVKHTIIRTHRHKYKCPTSLSGLVSAPLTPRIAPGSSLGDSFIMWTALSKFLYLNPSERCARIVTQSGFDCFAPQLVLAGQHACADFLRPVYRRLKRGVQQCVILFADETPHRMLEGDESNRTWYFWGFTGGNATTFEIHNTRSGEVAIQFLAESQCLYLMTDVYSGYIRAVREANVIRRAKGRPEIVMLYCNSHSRRRFTEAAVSYPDEAQFFIDHYAQIYRLEAELKLLTNSGDRKQKRDQMQAYFEAMVAQAQVLRGTVSDKSSLARAINYFLGNYQGLTQFLQDPHLPIDNNLSERQLRSPVIGRRTWLGTHSQRGAETTEILFTVFQSCNLAKVNAPRYLSDVIQALLNGDPPFTPQEYAEFTLMHNKAA